MLSVVEHKATASDSWVGAGEQDSGKELAGKGKKGDASWTVEKAGR